MKRSDAVRGLLPDVDGVTDRLEREALGAVRRYVRPAIRTIRIPAAQQISASFSGPGNSDACNPSKGNAHGC